MILLALARSNDEVARDVLALAAQAGLKTVRVGEEELASLLLRWELPESREPAYLVAGGRRIGVSELAGGLVRWLPSSWTRTFAEADEEYLEVEWRAALRGFLRALPCPVVNRPRPLERLRQPMLAAQAAVLRAAGLRLPHMLVAAGAKEERAFDERHGGSVTRVGLPTADSYPVYLVAAPEGIRRRVLVVGAEAYLDSRGEGAELPDDLARRCAEAVRGLDLEFAELTVVSGRDGDTLLDLTDTPDWSGCAAALRTRVAATLTALLAGAKRWEVIPA